MQKASIGSICIIKTGKLDANASSPTGKYPFFTCSREVLRIDNYAYDAECVLIAGNGELNVKYYKGKFNAYQRTYIITLKPEIKDVSVKYLYTFFTKYIETLRNESIGGIIKYIKLGNLTNAVLPVPPIAEQEKIVAELDCLTGIIEKKRQQLEELDKLAQSIFYDMFGNPITNEKGWEMKKLGDLCEVITKGTTPSSLGFSFVEEGINFLKVESFNSDETLNEAKIFHITKECDAALRRSRLETNDILMCIAGATCGRLAIVPSSVIPANTNQAFGIIRLKDKEQSFLRYIYSFLHSSFIRESVNDLMKGVAQPNLTLAHLRGFCILLPPPTLQNEFAKKIEAIEKQKELVKRSIAETETLFNSRMDYWFN